MSLDPTQSLLRWGIENAAPGSIKQMHSDLESGKRPDLDPAILKAMMGTSDADRMRECVNVIEGQWVDRDGTGEVKDNSEITEADRYRAWDDLEMASSPLTPSFLLHKLTFICLNSSSKTSTMRTVRFPLPLPPKCLLTFSPALQTCKTWGFGSRLSST
jgi:hypothetical protein